VATKPHVVVLSKFDLLATDEELPVIDAPESRGVLSISSVAHHGVDELKEVLWRLLAESAESPDEETVLLP